MFIHVYMYIYIYTYIYIYRVSLNRGVRKGGGGIPHEGESTIFARRVRRDTVPSRKCDNPRLIRGVSNCAQHLRDGTVSVCRGQSAIVPSSPEARDCCSPWLASPLFKDAQIYRERYTSLSSHFSSEIH